MGAMASWYRRRPQTSRAGIPSAWRYFGPTTDEASALTAAATKVTDKKVKRGNQSHDSWQEEAWAMYDQVGELRYVANAIAGRMGQAELYVEKDGERLDEEDPILALITPQMVERLGLNIFVAGAGYLAGLPLSPEVAEEVQDGTSIHGEGGKQTLWLILSAMEVKRSKGKVEIRGEKYKTDDIYLEKIWDPHPAQWEDADSPVRSALPVLRELVGLTQHVSAQIDSRLAGAGVYWIPNSILSSAKVPETGDARTTFSDNPVLNAIMQGMLLPMEDRSNAASVVPLLMGAPDEAISKIRYDTFATPFDKNTKDLREEAIRRLALNLDAPPELLLGMGGSNHWAAWLVRDEVVQIHVDPRLQLVTDALTTGFYRPIRAQQFQQTGMSAQEAAEEAARYDVGADTSKLVQRPNRLADASQLHAVNAIGDKALREAGGFEETDAPTSEERAIALALTVASANPQLLDNMSEIVAAVRALLDGTPDTGPDVVSSQREPGSLKPLAPGNQNGVRPPSASAPNGTPTANGREARPLGEQDTLPSAGSPV